MPKLTKRAISLAITMAMCVGLFTMPALAAEPDFYLIPSVNGLTITRGSNNNLSMTWTNCSFVAGIGWKTGSASRVISYNAGIFKQTNTSGCTYLSLYGWMKNSLVEYYVMENWINYKPAEGTKLGTISSDGGTYDVWRHQQVNQPSISGTQSYWQIFSLRQSQRTQGQNNTITFANHVNGWKNLGFSLGATWDYQIFAVEAYQSSGQANITVW